MKRTAMVIFARTWMSTNVRRLGDKSTGVDASNNRQARMHVYCAEKWRATRASTESLERSADTRVRLALREQR
eukprot:6211313-Pleurochrysis_carterae.AAC.3